MTYQIITRGNETEYIYKVQVKNSAELANIIANESRIILSIELINK